MLVNLLEHVSANRTPKSFTQILENILYQLTAFHYKSIFFGFMENSGTEIATINVINEICIIDTLTEIY